MLLPRSLHVLLVIACSPFTLADVEFTSPAPGDEVAGGTTLRVQWKDSGDAPSLADLKSYKLFLCAGGNANPVGCEPLLGGCVLSENRDCLANGGRNR